MTQSHLQRQPRYCPSSSISFPHWGTDLALTQIENMGLNSFKRLRSPWSTWGLVHLASIHTRTPQRPHREGAGCLLLALPPLSLWDQADEEEINCNLSSLAVGHTQLPAVLTGGKHAFVMENMPDTSTSSSYLIFTVVCVARCCACLVHRGEAMRTSRVVQISSGQATM